MCSILFMFRVWVCLPIGAGLFKTRLFKARLVPGKPISSDSELDFYSALRIHGTRQKASILREAMLLLVEPL